MVRMNCKTFLAIINLYFTCELLKTSGAISTATPNWQNCIDFFKPVLSESDMYKVCNALNHRENYTKFVYNLLFTLLICNVLILSEYTTVQYWLTAHLSAVSYSLATNLDVLKFSLETGEKYTSSQIIIITVVSILFAITILVQCRKIDYRPVAMVTAGYFICYVLLLISSRKISLHLHHSFCAGLLSLFFNYKKEMIGKINTYIHAALIGIVIQGINVYTIEELFIYKIQYADPPSVVETILLFTTAFSAWMVLEFKPWKKKEVEKDLYVEL